MISPHFLDDNRPELSAWVDESLDINDVDLTNCDREPIHIPNAIQPHGLLLVFHIKTLKLIQVSANIESMAGYSPASLQGKSLNTLLDLEQIQILNEQLSQVQTAQSSSPFQIQIQRADESTLMGYTLIHHEDPYIALEIEPISSASSLDYFQFSTQLKDPIKRIQKTQNLVELCNTAVQEIQGITGFNRVMVYRFHTDGSGSVIAESAQEGAVPYLGLRYPSTDIPRQAKQLYAINWLRIIPNVDYELVPLIDCGQEQQATLIDMSQIGLRSVSSMHVDYLKNMGVKASLSISLMHEGKLWGLIACHHNTSKKVALPIRTCCEFIGQIISSELVSKERQEILNQKNAQKSALNKIEEAILAEKSISQALSCDSEALLSLVYASGAAYFEQDQVQLFGVTPNIDQVQYLFRQIKPCFKDTAVYGTPRISQLVPEAETYSSKVSGVLGLAISKTQNIYLLWFRAELPQLITWAGNPHKPASLDENGQVYLTPRQSFARWVETVQLSSEPWGAGEVETALELRSSIIGLVLQKADELAKVNLELSRSNEDLASFAYVASHDLKAPLRGIANLACWIQEDLAGKVSDETQAQLDLLQSRVYRMHDMIQGLLQYSRVGDYAEAVGIVSIPDLISEILDSLAPPSTIQFELPQIHTLYETNKVLLKQVLTNLLSNAIKYIDRPDGQIGIQVNEETDGLHFFIIDNGPGIPPEYHDKIFQMFQTLQSRDEIESTGIGLAIVKKVILTQGGTISIQSNINQGSTFIFTWPNALPILYS